jgi:polysaccharide deacetylase family protein (PEP-CTERM system associated)
MINCLSIDLEDWYQGIESINFEDWPSYESRIVPGTRRVLSLLSDYSVSATFFVLGYIAEKFPALITDIADAGHEIAIHGYAHKQVFKLTKEEFKEDLEKTLSVIAQICDAKVIGYRAPLFSITKDSLWALDILADYGIKYDSSIYPFKTYMFGIDEAERHIHEIELSNSRKITEIPPSTIRIFNKNIPYAGGFFFRSWPYGFIKWALAKTNQAGYPAMVYLHPFDLDPDIPYLKGLSLKRRFIHYNNIKSTEKKIKRLLGDFSFGKISRVMNLDR